MGKLRNTAWDPAYHLHPRSSQEYQPFRLLQGLKGTLDLFRAPFSVPARRRYTRHWFGRLQ